jgi:thymidylate kinase
MSKSVVGLPPVAAIVPARAWTIAASRRARHSRHHRTIAGMVLQLRVLSAALEPNPITVYTERTYIRVGVQVMRAPLICFTGVDGCGKSTQTKRLALRLRQTGWQTKTVWTGGQKTVTGPLVRLGQQYLHAPRRGQDRRFVARDANKQAVDQEFSQYMNASHHLFRQHPGIGRAWIDLSLFEHAVEIDCAVLPHLRMGRAVICDRYIYKSLVNLAVLLDLSPARIRTLLRHPAVRLVPRPTLYFLLDVPAEAAFSRKTDLPSIEYVQRRVPVYRSIAAMTGMPVINATQSPDAIEAQVWDVVSRVLALRKDSSPQC